MRDLFEIKEEKGIDEMKKRTLVLTASVLACFVLASCSGGDQGAKESAPAANTPEPPTSIAPVVTGEWKQVNSNSEDSWQSATIDESTITVYWVSDNGDTKSLYWAGSFTPPETADEPYTWDSENDTEQTSAALLASGDETKTFTYENGQISYDVSALGTTTTVRLEKQ